MLDNKGSSALQCILPFNSPIPNQTRASRKNINWLQIAFHSASVAEKNMIKMMTTGEGHYCDCTRNIKQATNHIFILIKHSTLAFNSWLTPRRLFNSFDVTSVKSKLKDVNSACIGLQ